MLIEFIVRQCGINTAITPKVTLFVCLYALSYIENKTWKIFIGCYSQLMLFLNVIFHLPTTFICCKGDRSCI